MTGKFSQNVLIVMIVNVLLSESLGSPVLNAILKKDEGSSAQLNTFEAEVKKLEKFEIKNENLISRNDLPCDNDAKFKLQCASIRNAVRAWRKRSWMHGSIPHSSQLFDEAYRPQDSRHFDVSKSSSFEAKPEHTQDMHYADGTHLRSFTGVDQVYMGNYHAKAPFAVIIDCNSPDFNGVDGILGFGLEKAGSTFPTPILFALTDPHNTASNAQDLQRKFSFFSTDDAAEVQLGGYDPATVQGQMWYTRALSSEDFIVPVTSLKFGTDHQHAVELLQFHTPSSFGAPSILDSGTSCLVIPADNMVGQLRNNPWDDFQKNFGKEKSFWMQIGDRSFRIPPHQWYLSDTDEACVQPSPDSMDGLLIGDVFFREYMVEFDMTQRPTLIGIAELNKNYRPVTSPILTSLHPVGSIRPPAVTKVQLRKGDAKYYPPAHAQKLAQVNRIPVVNQQGTQYFMDVGVGTPRQTFTVIFDTGSTVFGVFSYKDKLPQTIKNKLPAHFLSQSLRVLEQASTEEEQLGWTWGLYSGFGGNSGSSALALALVNCGLLVTALFAGARFLQVRRRVAAAASSRQERWQQAMEETEYLELRHEEAGSGDA